MRHITHLLLVALRYVQGLALVPRKGSISLVALPGLLAVIEVAGGAWERACTRGLFKAPHHSALEALRYVQGLALVPRKGSIRLWLVGLFLVAGGASAPAFATIPSNWCGGDYLDTSAAGCSVAGMTSDTQAAQAASGQLLTSANDAHPANPRTGGAVTCTQDGGNFMHCIFVVTWDNAGTVIHDDQGINVYPVCMKASDGSRPQPLKVQSEHYTCPGTDPCAAQAGVSTTVNMTTGWNTVASGYKPLAGSVHLPTGLQCINGCYATINGAASAALANGSYQSSVPSSTGLYRLSTDLVMVGTGGSCSDSTPESATPQTPPASCPGTQGTLNGKTVCVGTGNTPIPVDTAASSPTNGTFGNPTAGPMPGSGPGSVSGSGAGRTPLVGDGSNAGGPSDAAVAPADAASGGSTTQPKDPCGLPGTAPCKIDETGTPDGSSVTAAANAAHSAGTALEGAVTNVSKPSSLGWNFGLSIPEGACTEFQFYKPGGTWATAICSNSTVGLLRSLLAWAMGIVTAVYCYRRVVAAVEAQG